MELYFETREEWRDWLNRNHAKAEEAWLIFFKKGSGKNSMPYPDAVEEALCYGWIDGKMKSVNKDYYLLRFTARRAGSRWSKYNIERVQKLISLGKMHAPGIAAFRKAIEKPELIYDNRADGDPEIPEDLMQAFTHNEKAFLNFSRFSQSSRRIYIEWLKNAKRPETRLRRIDKIISQAEKIIRPGIM